MEAAITKATTQCGLILDQLGRDALILSRAGWSQRQIADHLGISQKQVSSDVNDDITTNLTEELLREAIGDYRA